MSNETKKTQAQKDYELIKSGFGTYTEKKRVLKRLSTFEDSDNKAENKNDIIKDRISIRDKAYLGLPQTEIAKIQDVKLAEDRVIQKKEVTSLTEKDLPALAKKTHQWEEEKMLDVFKKDKVLDTYKTSIDTKTQEIKDLKFKAFQRKIQLVTT